MIHNCQNFIAIYNQFILEFLCRFENKLRDCHASKETRNDKKENGHSQ